MSLALIVTIVVQKRLWLFVKNIFRPYVSATITFKYFAVVQLTAGGGV